MMKRWGDLLAVVVSVGVISVSLFMMERGRAGLQVNDLLVGTTPATVYQQPGADGPLVVVAHGFAGSRQLMLAYSLTLAQSGYSVLAFDFEGHGRNPVPMSGDVDAIEGTTQRLVDETLRVLAAGRALDPGQGVALLGHSMATDIIARAAIADGAVDAVVGISMFSQAVTADAPSRLLVISGQWEAMLRTAALQMARLVDPAATEGETVAAGDVTRRVVVAPGVEHVGVLYSGTGLREARGWLDETFGRDSTGPVVTPGVWIIVLLAGIVMLFRPLVRVLPQASDQGARPSARRFWAAVLVPAVAVPVVAVLVYRPFLPVLVADYLMIHLALFGVAQLVILRVWPLPRVIWVAVLAVVVWGLGVFGLAIDRYAASFMPTAERLGIIAALAVGTVPFMLADGLVATAGWRRLVARLMFLASLAAAAFLDLDRLLFVLIILPVIGLFFLILGPLGRWVGRQSGAGAAGVGLGVILAWALGVSFPLFVAG